MLVKKRVILYNISFIFITIISLSMIFVLRGYYFDFSNFSFKKGGSVFIKSIPRTAKIFVNGKLKKKKSPINIPLPDGQYTIRVEKDGFYPWEKKIKIDSGFVNWQEFVFLIKIDKQEKNIAENISSFSVSKNKQKIAYSDLDGIIKTMDINGNNKKLVFKNEEKFKNIKIINWSKNNQSILVEKEITEGIKNFFILKNNKIINLPHIPGEISKIDFKYNSDQEILALSSEKLYSVKENSILTEDNNISDFSQTNSNIVYAKNENKESSLIKTSYDFKNKEIIIKSDINFLKVYSEIDNFIAYIKKDSSLWIYIEGKENKISDDADYAIWSPESKKLLFVKNGEIKVYTYKEENPRESKTKLLTRLSSSIDEIKWFYDQGHIIYRIKNNLNFIELDGSNSINLYKDAAEIIGFSTTNYGRELIYPKIQNNKINLIYSKIGEENGLIPY